MDRTERLLDLVALLLDATEPISWAQLREAFPEDYGQGSDEANERKFERDKAELLELGIPIRYVQGDDENNDGYVVDRESYYLPEVGLSPEELAVLYAAGSAALASGASPGRQDLAHALRKIGFFSAAEVTAPKVRMELGGNTDPELSHKLEQLWEAAAAFLRGAAGRLRRRDRTGRACATANRARRFLFVGLEHRGAGIDRRR